MSSSITSIIILSQASHWNAPIVILVYILEALNFLTLIEHIIFKIAGYPARLKVWRDLSSQELWLFHKSQIWAYLLTFKICRWWRSSHNILWSNILALSIFFLMLIWSCYWNKKCICHKNRMDKMLLQPLFSYAICNTYTAYNHRSKFTSANLL